MMRAILALIGIAALVLVGLMALGMLRFEQQDDAALPKIRFSMEEGRMPSFKAETGKISVGSTNTTVELPTVEMRNTTISLPTLEVEQASNGTAAAKEE
ncbi:hypothetical protein [Sphingosinithalassobacter sp. CS137]|uniref:hypothetical protein n=1 Tax=Sphingosinithalassobacter sp. CS137 TaxID=2762748 RepID=UPI00165E543D|nr:hypothetical protein [Sphingosinithalassobacter sp. CS137]